MNCSGNVGLDAGIEAVLSVSIYPSIGALSRVGRKLLEVASKQGAAGVSCLMGKCIWNVCGSGRFNDRHCSTSD